ncbi:MAG: AAA family ATPase [Schlesneria sp.]
MTSPDEPPRIFVIAGPNGAGKTTFANRFLPSHVHCTEFLNADLIAAGLSPFAPESQNIRASELMLERMETLVSRRATFSFETTLAARSYVRRIIVWKNCGFSVELFFVWLPSPDMAVARVANRVKQGGHGLPEETIRQRYSRGLSNFHLLYRPIVNHWSCFDGSQLPPQLIAQSKSSTMIVYNDTTWKLIEATKGTDQ